MSEQDGEKTIDRLTDEGPVDDAIERQTEGDKDFEGHQLAPGTSERNTTEKWTTERQTDA